MKTEILALLIVFGMSGLLAACGSSNKTAEVGECTDADCARAAIADPSDIPTETGGSAPGTITVTCGVFKNGEEEASPCGPVAVKVFAGNSATLKKQWTLSGEKLVIPEIAATEKVSLNLTLQGCAKPNLLPGLKSGDTRETYFKTPCQ